MWYVFYKRGYNNIYDINILFVYCGSSYTPHTIHYRKGTNTNYTYTSAHDVPVIVLQYHQGYYPKKS